ncbi:MAG: DUF4384 domain-containing protein [Bacteroidota bacterium]
MIRSLVVAAVVSCAIAFAQEKTNVSFEWAFGTLSGSGADAKLVTITRDTTLASGDELKLMVKLKQECFVYVIHESPTGEISLKFPYDLKQFTTDYKVGKNYYIPKGRPWFKLDANVGRETFYLLASAERLLDLEALTSKYKDADASGRPAVAKEIVAEIRNVRKHYKTFTTFAERPISIGGNVRSLTKDEVTRRPDVAQIATEVSANNFYGKTFTIDHK